ncbi:MFS transporter, partial [Exiguobacterium sp.]
MQNNTLILSTLLLNLFIAFLGIGLVIPVTPTIMNELSISGATVGYMVSAFAFAQLILSPLAGRAVDKYGR